jgi:hypothetical protein
LNLTLLRIGQIFYQLLITILQYERIKRNDL